jgi:hypothetical protein
MKGARNPGWSAIRRVRLPSTCIAAGLVGGEGFAVDASLIQADADFLEPRYA